MNYIIRGAKKRGARVWKVEVFVSDFTGKDVMEVENEVWNLVEGSEHLTPIDISVEEQ